MNRSQETFFIATLLVAPFLFSFIAPPQGGGTPPGEAVLVGSPPGKLGGVESWDGMESLGGTYSVFGRAAHQLHAKRVVVDYNAKHNSTGKIVLWRELNEAVSYWPTSVTFLEKDLIVVAGKGQDSVRDNTVIEVWRLTVPGVRAAIDPQTGESTLELYPLAVRSKLTVFDEAVAGKDMVRGLIRLRGKPHALLVQFYDSGDLYELDYTHAVVPPAAGIDPLYPLTKILRASPGSDVPYVSGLADRRLLWMHGSDHQDLGHIYFLWPSFETQTTMGPNSPTPLSLFDTDRDGTLDYWEQSSEQENQATGILDESLYTEKFLRTVW